MLWRCGFDFCSVNINSSINEVGRRQPSKGVLSPLFSVLASKSCWTAGLALTRNHRLGP